MHLSARFRAALFALAIAALLCGCATLSGAEARSGSESYAEAAAGTAAQPDSEPQRQTAAQAAPSVKTIPVTYTYPGIDAAAKAPAGGEKAKLSARQELQLYSRKQAQKKSEPAAREDGVPGNLVLVDTFIATAYCQTGTTATGTQTTVGRTLSVNPNVIPYGTHVWIYLDDGTLVGDYYAEDTGSNMQANPYVVDIYLGPSRDACVQWGARHVSIYVEG